MKKSFKKAGAAVLSMSMLLAMGASAMPVYAAPGDTHVDGDENTHVANQTQPWPGQIEVSLDNGNWADDSIRTFDYLSNIKDATVRIYKVAELYGDGWKWEDPFKSSLLNANGTVVTGGPTLADFETLLAVDTNDNFTATSEQLKELASALERVVMNASGNFDDTSTPHAIPVSEGKLDSTGGATVVYLPHDEQLDEKTMNHVAYYLISTVTDDAGVVIQPALITLKNSKSTDATTDQNVRKVKLKGSNIDVDKKITKVWSEDKDKSLVTAVAGDISSTSNTAIASEKDLITFEIETQLPTYDAKVTASSLDGKVTLTDTPEDGIALTDTSGSAWGDGIKVYPQAATGNAYSDTPLVVNQDYTITGPTVGGGFTITFVGNALCYGSNNAPDGVTGASTQNKLQGQKIKVVFQGKIDDDINKGVSSEDAAKNYANLTATDVSNMLDFANSLKMTTGAAKYSAALADAEDATPGAYYIDTTEEATIYDLLNPGNSTAAADKKLTDEEKVAAYLALKKIHQAGDENKAVLTYGNQYSTGNHPVEREDRVKVFSVDLDLTKIANQLLIEEDSTTESQDYQVKDSADATKKKVKSAVLELKKLDDAGGSSGANLSGAESYGLAITDENGKLWMLEKNDDAADPAYKDGNGQKWTIDAGNKAWTNLKAGTYQLEEVKAPTGYKKFDTFTFKINATTGTDGEYNGVFSADSFTPNTAGTAVGDVLTPYPDGANTGTLFTFVSGVTKDGVEIATGDQANNGELKAEIIDPPADVLPATGGIGTVLFTAGGIAVVMLAGALFVVYMKKRNTDEEE